MIYWVRATLIGEGSCYYEFPDFTLFCIWCNEFLARNNVQFEAIGRY